MNKSLLKEKLKSYSALATAVFGSAAAADAQIVYTDVNPDFMSTTTNGNFDTYEVDFNNDGTSDLAVGTYGYLYNYGGTDYQFNYVLTIVQNSNVAAMVGTMQTLGSYSFAVTSNVASGATIGPSSTWLDTTAAGGTQYFNAVTQNGTTMIGTANTGSDVYLGARFMIGADTYYGWVRIVADAGCTSLTVKDFAYNSTADGPINAGQTTLGLTEIEESAWNTYVSNNNIIVKSDIEGTISVFGVDGTVIGNGEMENGTFTLNAANAAKGVYIVRITSGSVTATKKIILN